MPRHEKIIDKFLLFKRKNQELDVVITDDYGEKNFVFYVAISKKIFLYVRIYTSNRGKNKFRELIVLFDFNKEILLDQIPYHREKKGEGLIWARGLDQAMSEEEIRAKIKENMEKNILEDREWWLSHFQLESLSTGTSISTLSGGLPELGKNH